MAQNLVIDSKGDVYGCIDAAADNFNYTANISTGPNGPYLASNCPAGSPSNRVCSGTCYKVIVGGGGNLCRDPQANNFNMSLPCRYGDNVDSDVVVEVDANPNGFLVGFVNSGNNSGNNSGDNPNPPNEKCDTNIYTISLDGEILYNSTFSLTEECCTYYQNNLNNSVSWDPIERKCNLDGTESLCESYNLDLISSEELQNRVTCIDCDNFAWWDNLYTTINGDTLQHINAPLWDFLVSVITSDPTSPIETVFGNGSFYVDILTGEPIISEDCCTGLANSNFVVNTNEFDEESSVCLCDTIQETITVCECLETVEGFLALSSTVSGASLLLTPNVLSSLGFTSDEIIFIIANAFNPNDTNNDDVLDNVQIRVLLSNALALHGGFYLCYETSASTTRPITSSSARTNRLAKENEPTPNTNVSGLIPQGVSSAKCEELGGFFDGTLCFCKPQDECNIRLTNITMTSTLDAFNQNITTVTIDGESISEACCLKIASENHLSWVYEEYNGSAGCYTSDPNPCLPLEFKLNDHLIKPKCETPIDVSVSFYFGKPENPCTPFVEDDDDDIIVDEPVDPCILEFDEHNNLVDYNTTRPRLNRIPPRTPASEVSLPPFSGDTETPCCYNSNVPIEVNLVIRDDKGSVIQTSESFSFVDVETWFDITTQFTIPTTGTTEGFNTYLQFTSGLNCCCIYDIFLDNFNFNCNEVIDIIEIIDNDCPGFKITPVIDNKKSWVYNPGEINYSNIQNNNGKLTDNIIINQGQFGLIQGYGVINRTFAPSLDADLDWRYTDYFKQSSVLEKHSNLVLNSKELFLTFDMCSDCCVKYGPCPEGYTLSAGTETCYKYVLDTKQFQNNVNFDFQDGVGYDFN